MPSVDAMDLELTPLKSAAKQGEEEFVRTFPTGQWLLVRMEEPRKLSEVLQGEAFQIRSPYATVIAVGPEFRADVKAGDRVTYAEALGLPKELEHVKWTRNYKWIHENKFLGRLPRGDESGPLKVTRPAGAAGSEEEEANASISVAGRKWVELCTKMGKNPYDPKTVLGG